MKLRENTIISDEKLKEYLLAPRKRNDKFKWLAQAGYTLENWRTLQNDLRNQILVKDASFIESSAYGNLYEIRGILKGPAGKGLPVRCGCSFCSADPQNSGGEKRA
jgi:hypothetical protein